MSDELWQFAQIMMWALGVQMTIIISVMTGFYSALSKRIDKLDEKVTDIDRRLCRLEGAFSSKDCCMIKDDRQIKKVE